MAPMSKNREMRIRCGLFATSLLALAWGYQLLLFRHAPDVFNSDLEDLSYGWYVPLFSLYVLWSERRSVAASAGEPSWLGLVFAVPFAFAGFLGARGAQVRLEMVGFIGCLIGLTWTYFGVGTARRTLFPALFLLFCLPLHTYLDLVTVHLRLFAVSVAHTVLNGCGVDVVRNGTMLTSPTGSFAVDVADPCSGIRSLFAMMTLTAGYAYFTQPTWLRRGLLFALSMPIAVVGNIFRIFSIVAVAAFASHGFATGFYHDYSGYVVFLVATALMVAVGGLITKAAERKAAEGGERCEGS